jgi:hypothetical protein
MRTSNIFIDYISFTYGIKSEKRRIKIHRALNKPVLGVKALTCIKSTGKSLCRGFGSDGKVFGYYDTYLLTFSRSDETSFTADVSINPSEPSNNFLRVATNPTKAGLEGMQALFEVLHKILGKKHASRIYSGASVTRVDITVDVFGLKRTYYGHLAGRSWSEINRENDGFTQIIGKGQVRLSIYDKALEQALKSPSREIVHPNWLRYEFCLRDLRCSISKLAEVVNNPFLDLSLYKDTFLTDDYFEDSFISKVKKHGLNLAIHELQDEPTRRRYRYRLKRYKSKGFKAVKMWKGWPDAADIFKSWETTLQ